MKDLRGTNFVIHDSGAYARVILIETTVETNLKFDTCFLDFYESLINDGQRSINRFLTEDVLSGTCGGDDLLGMLVRSRADTDGIDAWVIDKFIVIIVRLTTMF